MVEKDPLVAKIYSLPQNGRHVVFFIEAIIIEIQSQLAV